MSHIAIITGGTSSERTVSLRSAESVLEALKEIWYTVKTYDFPKDADAFLSGERPEFTFIMVHGKDGEDGKIPAFLEVLGIAHQSTSFEKHSLCLNKIQTKDVWKRSSLPIARDAILSPRRTKHEFLEELQDTVGFPCVIKVPTEGSTIGIFILPDINAFSEHWDEISMIESELLVEQFISGREVTVSLLDMPDGSTRVLPVIEIIPPEGKTFDYENKYNGKTQEICPAPLSKEESQYIHDTALHAYKVLWMTGYGRIDAILKNDGRLRLLEINTIPGFTKQSLFPLAAKTAGISFSELLKILMTTWKKRIK